MKCRISVVRVKEAFTSGRIMDFCRENLHLQLIRELPEFVEIDTRPEAEGIGNRLRREMASGRGFLADAGANCSINRAFLKGMPSSRARCFNNPARSSSSIRVIRISGISDASDIDVKTSTRGRGPRRANEFDRAWRCGLDGRE